MKHIFLTTLLLASTILTSLWGQNELDVYRYSLIERGGTARFMSLGGAMGALGADFGAISTNPAALGVYRKGELMVTGNVVARTMNVGFEDTNTQTNDAYFNFSNAGLVFTTDRSESSGWKKVSFAFGYNRLNSFRQESNLEADYFKSSLLNQYVNQANGTPDSLLSSQFPFGAGQAWDTYLINPGEDNDIYVPAAGVGTNKTITRSLEERGAMGETVFGVGGNYMDKLFVGGSLILNSVRYTQEISYKEKVTEENYDLDFFRRKEELTVNGGAATVKVGAIYKPIEQLRIGGAVHSATVYNLNDSYTSVTTSRFTNGDFYETNPETGNFAYRVKTPPRFIASAAFIMGKGGFVTAEYEMVDYTKAKLKSELGIAGAYDYEFENQIVKNSFRKTHNVRAGFEWRVVPTMRVRAGIQATQNPFKSTISTQSSTWLTYSGGFGYRKDGVFLDIGMRLTEKGQDVYIYDPSLVDVADYQTLQTEVFFTIGSRITK